MNVIKVLDAGPGKPSVRLVDDDGEPVAEVDMFLRLLAVREYSPNTIRAYAHDLQKLFAFLAEAGIAASEFTPARAAEFLQWLRLASSSRRGQRLELGITVGGGRVLSAKTCNRVMAAVSSFYEFLIASDAYAGRDNPIVKVADKAAARVPGRYRPPLDNASRQQPVRRVLRVKTVEALPRPMTSEVYSALLEELRTRRGRALLEVMWEGGLRPGEVLGLRMEDISYGRRRVAVRKRNDHPRQVRQKSRRDRVVDLLEGRALPALNDYIMRERPADADCPWVFLVGGKGKRRCEPLGYDALVRMFARAAAGAGRTGTSAGAVALEAFQRRLDPGEGARVDRCPSCPPRSAGQARHRRDGAGRQRRAVSAWLADYAEVAETGGGQEAGASTGRGGCHGFGHLPVGLIGSLRGPVRPFIARHARLPAKSRPAGVVPLPAGGNRIVMVLPVQSGRLQREHPASRRLSLASGRQGPARARPHWARAGVFWRGSEAAWHPRPGAGLAGDARPLRAARGALPWRGAETGLS